jgi:hypothetical protein
MKRLFIIPALAGLLLSGCYPDSPDYTEVYDLVVTNHDDAFNFNNVHTFAIPDSVVEITGDEINDPDGDGKPEFVDPSTGNVIIKALRENLVAYGWTETSKDSADVLILPSAMKSTTIVYYYDYWYYDWWYGGYYGWYYPGYYPSYSYSYTTGTLFTQMIYPDGVTPDHNMPVIWTCIVNGLLTGSNTNSRINSTIDQAFEQSPYLRK